MKTSHLYQSVFMVFLIAFPIVLCRGSEQEGYTSGAWVMEDTQKMAKFLGLKKQKGYYCLEFRPHEGKACVKFLYSKVSYPLQVQPTGPNHYRLLHGKETRDVFISRDTSKNTGETRWYWHFSDSAPYNPQDMGVYDGSKELGDETINKCIKKVRDDYEFDIQEHPEQ